MALTGIGAGISLPALTGIALSGIGEPDAGLASGLISSTGQIGGALGLAVFAAVSGASTRTLSAAGDSLPTALVGGYHVAFWLATGLTVGAFAVAAVALPGSNVACRVISCTEGGQPPPAESSLSPEKVNS